jgi:hypothetical protein
MFRYEMHDCHDLRRWLMNVPHTGIDRLKRCWRAHDTCLSPALEAGTRYRHQMEEIVKRKTVI